MLSAFVARCPVGIDGQVKRFSPAASFAFETPLNLGLAWLELGLDWLGLAWLSLAWLGLAGLGFICSLRAVPASPLVG